MAEPTATPRFRIYFEPLPVYRHDDPLVAAANAGPSWSVQFKPADDPGALPRAFPLWHPMDLQWLPFSKLQAIDQEVSSGGHLSRVPEKVKLLMPDLPDDVLTALTANQIVSIALKSGQIPGEEPETQAREGDAANPPAGERASVTSSRSPRDSSAGATGS
jgi:hypothetical protein